MQGSVISKPKPCDLTFKFCCRGMFRHFRGNAREIQAKSGLCENLFVMFSNKFHVTWWTMLLTVEIPLGPPKAYYLKIFEKHDIEISITAWFSHALPLNDHGPYITHRGLCEWDWNMEYWRYTGWGLINWNHNGCGHVSNLSPGTQQIYIFRLIWNFTDYIRQ